MSTQSETPQRRTKRRYAHELYPHAGEWETRPLTVEVPYLYALFVGHSVQGTGWFSEGPRKESQDRITRYIDCGRTALLADALAQGVTGDAAWAWADERVTDDMEIAYERAAHYGVPLDRIKPYPCGPEPEHHYHEGRVVAPGWRESVTIQGRESDCPDCTESIEGNPS